MTKKNSNDITAKFYDIVSNRFKGESLSNEELNLIKDNCKENAKILDIGCGTGRHLIPLSQEGFKLTGIDSSSEMLKILKKKKSLGTKILNADFMDYDFKSEKFDLIILFWNTFNEICLTKKIATKFLNKCKKLLTLNGKIIINSDNTDNIDPKHFDFSTEETYKDNKIKYEWKTEEFLKKTNTSISQETVHIDDLKFYRTKITQRWWTLYQYKSLAEKTGYIVTESHIKQDDELYLVFRKR